MLETNNKVPILVDYPLQSTFLAFCIPILRSLRSANTKRSFSSLDFDYYSHLVPLQCFTTFGKCNRGTSE